LESKESSESSQEETSSNEYDEEVGNTRIFSKKKSRVIPSLNELEIAYLEFSISLLSSPAKEDEYELPFINALAVLGLTEKGF